MEVELESRQNLAADRSLALPYGVKMLGKILLASYQLESGIKVIVKSGWSSRADYIVLGCS